MAVNIRRLYVNLQMGAGCVGGRSVLSLDAAKAFNSVAWPFLWVVLRRMGFGPKFLSWVHLLYRAPTARIRVNSLLSNFFGVWSGLLINCDKSSFPPESVPLQVVSEFKYLGVVVSLRPQNFLVFNLLPILARINSKVDGVGSLCQ